MRKKQETQDLTRPLAASGPANFKYPNCVVSYSIFVCLMLSHVWPRRLFGSGLAHTGAEKRQLVGQRSVCHIPPKGLIARGEESEERGGTM